MDTADYKILVIAKEADDRRRLRSMLKHDNSGQAVIAVQSWSEALDHLSEKSADAIVLMRPPESEDHLPPAEGRGLSVPAISIVTDKESRAHLPAGVAESVEVLRKNDLSPILLSKTVEHAIERSLLRKQIEAYETRLENCESENKRFVSAAIAVTHDLAQPLQVLGNTLELVTAEQVEGEKSYSICRKMMQRMVLLIRDFRQSVEVN